MGDELEHVLLDSDEVSSMPLEQCRTDLDCMSTRKSARGPVVVKLRMITLTGRTLTLQKAVQILLRLTRTCQMTISIASCKAPLFEQPQSLRQPVCKQQPCRSSLLHPHLLAKVTMLFAWRVAHINIHPLIDYAMHSYAHLGPSRGAGPAAESCSKQVSCCCKSSGICRAECCFAPQSSPAACPTNAWARQQYDVQACGQRSSNAAWQQCSSCPWQTSCAQQSCSGHAQHSAALGFC